MDDRGWGYGSKMWHIKGRVPYGEQSKNSRRFFNENGGGCQMVNANLAVLVGVNDDDRLFPNIIGAKQ